MGDEENDKLTIVLIGSYPPPYGGVSVHIQRLQTFLSNNGVHCIVYEYNKPCSHLKNNENIINIRKIKNWRHILNPKGRVIHIHNSRLNLKKIIIYSLLCKLRGKNVIITYHALTPLYEAEHFSWLKKRIAKLSSKFVFHYIAVSPQIKNKLVFLNINSNKISVIPAFLPPAIKQRDIDDIPQEIWDFVKNHSPIISANAFKISFYNNQDLYGVNMCIDLCANLQNAYPKIGLVFCLPDIGDYDYFDKMKRRITEKGIENNFLFVTQPYQLYPLLMKSDIFVRPTNTDGDAVSIREALYFKIPVVASDVVLRPEMAILFKNRDINAFTLKVKDILNNYEWHKKKLEPLIFEDNFEKIMKVYQKLTRDDE